MQAVLPFSSDTPSPCALDSISRTPRVEVKIKSSANPLVEAGFLRKDEDVVLDPTGIHRPTLAFENKRRDKPRQQPKQCSNSKSLQPYSKPIASRV